LVGHYTYCSCTRPSLIYYVAIHLVNSILWIAAYQNLESLKPGGFIKLAVLNFFLSWKSHQSQHSGNSANCFYYLNTETIEKLTGHPDHDNALVQKCLGFDAQHINHAPVIFLVTFGQNTYFLALFDFSEKKALILGRQGLRTLDIVAVHAEWDSLDGPTLWNRIGGAFSWLTSEMREAQPMVVVYEANWISVYLCLTLLL
jgi:hypothetical protein